VVYVNGRYHGIYTVTDHVDVELFSGAGLAAGGNLYKAIGHDAGFFPGAFHPEAYEKRSGFRGPVWLGAYSDLESLSRFIAESEPAVFRRQLAERISLDDYRAWFIAATAMEADDTLAKNAYHYREPGGRWRVVPFDFNASFGQEWDTRRVRGDRDPLALASFNHLFVRLLEDPQLGGETKSRFAAALRHDVPLSAVLAALDGLVAEVAPAAARDERRWRDEYLAFPRWRARQDFTDFDGEVAYVRRWIGERWSYLLTHI
jgi:spore coat protein H